MKITKRLVLYRHPFILNVNDDESNFDIIDVYRLIKTKVNSKIFSVHLGSSSHYEYVSISKSNVFQEWIWIKLVEQVNMEYWYNIVNISMVPCMPKYLKTIDFIHHCKHHFKLFYDQCPLCVRNEPRINKLMNL